MNLQLRNQDTESYRSERDWWRGAVIYQIYPRSFQDSNGDGVGDIAGITERLHYVASLGVDAIWISPFFRSPMRDFGYDVSDHCDVDPMFGTVSDFDALLTRAHELGLRVFIDLVLSHTSDQHLWFQESRGSRDNPRSDWYVWADPSPDGTPPNNWLSIFGGSAWQWEGRRQQYFMHNFLASQPDLNLHNLDVQNALLDVAKFWLERGVDGFRLDTINFYMHDRDLRHNPPLAPDLRNANIAPQVNPYNHQDHLYDKNQPENLEFLRKLRAVMEPYCAAALGEVGDAQRGLEILGQYTAGDDLIHMCYAFEFLANDRPTASDVAAILNRVDEVASDGWPCWAFSNHDTQRHASRWELGQDGLRMMTTLMMCLRGTACIYQGEELGLEEADLDRADLRDPYGIEFWPEFKGRDGCRTPMVWKTQDQHAGFGTVNPWLPVCTNQASRAVDRQENDPSALIHHYRKAIAFRKSQGALKKGAQSPLDADGPVLSFSRMDDGGELFLAFNLGDEATTVKLPAGRWASIGQDIGSAEIGDGDLQALLGPWQCMIVAKQEDKSNG